MSTLSALLPGHHSRTRGLSALEAESQSGRVHHSWGVDARTCWGHRSARTHADGREARETYMVSRVFLVVGRLYDYRRLPVRPTGGSGHVPPRPRWGFRFGVHRFTVGPGRSISGNSPPPPLSCRCLHHSPSPGLFSRSDVIKTHTHRRYHGPQSLAQLFTIDRFVLKYSCLLWLKFKVLSPSFYLSGEDSLHKAR